MPIGAQHCGALQLLYELMGLEAMNEKGHFELPLLRGARSPQEAKSAGCGKKIRPKLGSLTDEQIKRIKKPLSIVLWIVGRGGVFSISGDRGPQSGLLALGELQTHLDSAIAGLYDW